jgi:hypothetical protein
LISKYLSYDNIFLILSEISLYSTKLLSLSLLFISFLWLKFFLHSYFKNANLIYFLKILGRIIPTKIPKMARIKETIPPIYESAFFKSKY